MPKRNKSETQTLIDALRVFEKSYDGLLDVVRSFTESSDGAVTVTSGEVVMESVDFGDYMPAKEAGLSHVPVKLIGPGWGSHAYYSEALLKKSGPVAFRKGTHMYWNHASSTEEAERPEGDLNNLAAVLTKDAYWDQNGAKGPGLYSEAKVFSDYSTQLAEKGPHIGVSINAAIKFHEGEADGKVGRIADDFIHAFSTDFVTKAGAKGAPVMESQRVEAPQNQQVKEGSMSPEEIKAAEDARTAKAAALATENADLKARLQKMETGSFVSEAVRSVSLALTEAEIEFNPKLVERACISPVIKEGKLDPEWLKGIVADFSPVGGGRIEGNGAPLTKESSKETGARIRETMKRLGVPEAGLDVASSLN